ncbi:MAG TPA: type II secretion system protein [Candidatus Gracilibacteria bacterium]|nr:type II secretion system protein [Candidatus Gracilibacteria bacterium]
MTRKAFTLVEMLVVITIVAILAVIAVSSYGAARRVARLDIVADSVVSMLKERQQKAKSGVVTPTQPGTPSATGSRNSSQPHCYGLFFSTAPEAGSLAVEVVETPYFPVGPQGADYCDLVQAETDPLDVVEDFKILNIQRFETETEELLILFKPPFARVVLGTMNTVSAPGTEYTQDLLVTLGLPEGQGERTVRYNIASGIIERVYAQQTPQQ